MAIAIGSAIARAEEPSAPPAFKPGEISIGEPIPLPYGGNDPAPGVPPPVAPIDDPRAARPAGPAGAPVPGSGWLGLAVGESNVPGRWRVEEVASGGPADRAGIFAGDELRAVNGTPLSSAEEVSQALTAIAAGQDVRVAVARGERVTDVVLRAEARPPTRPATVPTPAPVPPPAAIPPLATAPARPAEVDWQPAPRAPPPPPAPGPFVPPGPALQTPVPVAGRPALGVRTVPIDPVMQARFNLAEPTGAYVIGVVQDLPAGKAGVPPGSVIVALGDQRVRSPLELTKLVSSGPLDRPVTLQFVLPGGESKRAAVVLQSLDASLERVLVGPGDEPHAAGNPAPVARRAERPAGDGAAIRAEIRVLRDRLERLERLLAPAGRGGR